MDIGRIQIDINNHIIIAYKISWRSIFKTLLQV